MYSEFKLKDSECDEERNRIDDISDGQDYSIDAVRYAQVLRG